MDQTAALQLDVLAGAGVETAFTDEGVGLGGFAPRTRPLSGTHV